jgi:hypothetical protein
MVPAEIVQACAGLRGMAQQSGYRADLCRPGSEAQWSGDCVCVCVFVCVYMSGLAVLRAWLCGAYGVGLGV